jgi:CHASE2 domain-containing sensor protein
MSWLARHRRLAFAAICTFWTAVVFVGYFFPTLPFISMPWRGEQSFEDTLRREGRKTATRDDFIFIGIDQQSLQLDAVGPEEIAGNRAFELMTGRPYPWSREIWVLLLDRLFGAGAPLVIFDLIFNNPNDGDPAFRAALDRYHDRVVVAMNIDTQNNTQIVLPNAQLIPPPAQTDDRVGFVNYWNDEIDGKLRAARFFTSERQLAGVASVPGDEIYTSLPSRALTKLGHDADIPQDQRDHLFRFSLASRLEGLTRIYGVDILVGTAADLIRDEFHMRSVARAQVKGKTEPVDVFAIVEARTAALDQELLIWLETYEEGIRKFRDRDFTQAKILFSRFLEFYPEDSLAKMYLERSLEYEQAPPDQAWNAVEVFERK